MNGKNGTAKKIAAAALAAGVAGAALTAYDVPPWLVDEIRKYGPASFLLLGLAAAIKYYIPQDAVPSFLQSQKDQAVAIAGVAEQLRVMSGQAGKLDAIIEKIDELKLDVSIFGDRLRHIEEHRVDGKRQDDL